MRVLPPSPESSLSIESLSYRYSKYLYCRVDTLVLTNGMHPVCASAVHKRDASRLRAQRQRQTGCIAFAQKRTLPGSLHNVVRIWVRNHQNTSQDSRDVLFLKKGPCQEACTQSSGFGSEITKTHPKISRDVLFQKKKAPARKPAHSRPNLGEKSIFPKVDFRIYDPSEIEATCLLTPPASSI